MDYTIKIWDIEKKACLVTIDTGTYFDVAYSLKLITLNTIACGSNKSIKIYNIGNGMCFKILKGHVDFVNCLILTKGGILISGSDDKTIKFWDTNEGICVKTLTNDCEVHCLLILNIGHVASGSDNGLIKIWNIDS